MVRLKSAWCNMICASGIFTATAAQHDFNQSIPYELSLMTRGLKNVQCSVAFPWNCTDSLVLFLQPGVHADESRVDCSGLVGSRFLILNTYLLGAHLGLDYNPKHHVTRLAWGFEFGLDATAIAFNQYTGHDVSDKSVQKPRSTASGYDVSITRYWSLLPWLENDIRWETYKTPRAAHMDFGELVTKETTSASLLSIGIGFRLMPIVKLKSSYGFGQGAKKGLALELSFKIRIGDTLGEHFSPGSIPYLQSLDGRMYSTVDRSLSQVLY